MASGSERLFEFRQALLPVSADPSECFDALVKGGPSFTGFVLSQDLGPLWHYTLQNAGLLESLPSETVRQLADARRAAAAAYMSQRAALGKLDQLFDREGIRYAVMKGALVRERVYPEHTLRLSSDMDILVAANDRQKAARLLHHEGYALHLDLANISHEATLSKPPVDIDLHWNILRPGRTRVDMTTTFLNNRQRLDGFWALLDTDTLFMMLTHPAFAKYVCSPNMGLARVADFLLWVQHVPVEWHAVMEKLDRAGLKTAAWVMLTWYAALAPGSLLPLLSGWRKDVQPGNLRAAYLRYWVEHDLPSRFLSRPLPIQTGFTLFMHDRLTDALHALNGLREARRDAFNEARCMAGELDRQAG